MASKVEKLLERTLYSARWLLVPLLIGLIVALALVVARAGLVLWSMISDLDFDDEEPVNELVIDVLQLLDLALIGALIIVVMIAGYETFVSRMEVARASSGGPTWMSHVDFSSMKMKLIGSIIAISLVELLKDFVSVMDDDYDFSPDKIKWRIFLHLVFLASGVAFAAMDYLANRRLLEAMSHD